MRSFSMRPAAALALLIAMCGMELYPHCVRPGAHHADGSAPVTEHAERPHHGTPPDAPLEGADRGTGGEECAPLMSCGAVAIAAAVSHDSESRPPGPRAVPAVADALSLTPSAAEPPPPRLLA